MMKRIVPGLLFLLVAAVVTSGEGIPGVSGRLEIVPPQTLPGIPVSYRLTVRNDSPAPVSLQGASLFILDETGAPTQPQGMAPHEVATYGFYIPGVYDEEDEPRVIPPGGEHEQWIPISMGLTHSREFEDPRLMTPGRVNLQFVFHAEEGDFASNPAVLEIQQPQGVDRIVYELMKETAGGSWTLKDWGRHAGKISRKVFESQPQSRYLPYFFDYIFVNPTLTLSEHDQAIAASEGTIIGDILKRSKAGILAVEADHVYAAADLDRAIDLAEEARSIYERLLRTTRYSFIRQDVTKDLERLATRAQLEERYHWQFERNAPPLKIKPLVECVTRGLDADKSIVRFGYENPNGPGKAVPVGSGNRIVPGEPFQGQPRYFRPGRNADIFSVVSKKKTDVRWELEGQTARVTPDTPACTTPSDAVKIIPVVDCIERQGNHFVVRFGYHNFNPYAVVVPFGEQNAVDLPDVKGQPTLFLPGVHRDAWEVKVKNASSITWTLHGKSVTASIEDAQHKCPKTKSDGEH